MRAYAHDLRDYFEFLGCRELQWDRVVLEDLGRFVTWLRLPGEARDGRVAVLPWVDADVCAATVNRKLSALASFYEFHQRHGVELGELLITLATGPAGRVVAGRSWRTWVGARSGTGRSRCAQNGARPGN